VTRCAVRTDAGFKGFGYVAGCRKLAAERIAVLDAMLQDPAQGRELLDRVIQPLVELIKGQKKQVARVAGASKVNFFTMPRTRTGK
jgi:alpha-D-ribose 1-methylphosphonate 5-triphosphate synthase subunit PhnG